MAEGPHAPPEERAIAGAGTGEADWLPFLDQPARRPALHRDVAAVLPGDGPVLVVAAHPDDEVLAVGGTMRRLSATGADLHLVWASDGEASHPASRSAAVPGLAATRRAESGRALVELGVQPAGQSWLGLPDSGLAAREQELTDALTGVLRRLLALAEAAGTGVRVLAPWVLDGHPDHETCGRAALRAAAQATGHPAGPDGAGPEVRVLLFPIWLWHWARPGGDGAPWPAAVGIGLSETDLAAKRAAIGCFASQVLPLGPDPADAPVLPPSVLARFLRDHELLLPAPAGPPPTPPPQTRPEQSRPEQSRQEPRRTPR